MFSVLSFRTTSTNNRLLIDGTVGWRLIFLGFAARQAKLRAERSLKSLRIVSPPILGRYNRRKPTRSPRQRGRAETVDGKPERCRPPSHRRSGHILRVLALGDPPPLLHQEFAQHIRPQLAPALHGRSC